MQEDWQDLVQGTPLSGTSELKLSRARAIAAAVERHVDYTMVRCARLEKVAAEVLVVDVESHGVPPHNAAGIEFRERVGLVVFEDENELVEVLALRPGFPRLMHQNATPPRCPPSLCLYFEPTRAVRRTWTAESFLRRIQMWLEKSARDELHPADQPVEQLFFKSSEELVLPWNVDELLTSNPVPAFEIQAGPERGKHGRTYFLVERTPSAAEPPSLSFVQLHLPAVVHGCVEPDAPTLGDLVDMLKARGVDLLHALKDAIYARVGEQGVAAAADTAGTVVLLHMGISRTEGAAPEKTARRAYLVNRGLMVTGELMGTLISHEKKFYRQPQAAFLDPGERHDWRPLSTTPIEVVSGLRRAQARSQSGIEDPGPQGTVVGAGALGGALLEMWTRSGWGEWTAIDNDHVKPHNVVRHPADQRFVGYPKPNVAAARADEILQGAGRITAIIADACDLKEGKPLPALVEAELVIDASTTLEYPRMASQREDVARHASVFLTPKANGSALLLEDSKRSIRLRTLEAQYYRALINSAWGEDHLDGNLGSFWSGAGCRDISVVMPYTAVLSHAALLAEQVRLHASAPGPAIHVWTRDAASGAITPHVVVPEAERVIQFDEMHLSIDEAVVEKMHELRQKNLPHETGGILIGYHDLLINSIVVVDALAAPVDSRATEGAFERGIHGVAEAANEAHRRTAGVVGYIGEWHSHPPHHNATPSTDDLYQLAHLALGMSHDGLSAVSLVVGAGGDLQAMTCEVR